MWVEFERDKFSRIRPKMVDVISDILGYPNVLEFKNKVDAIELCTMDKASFDNEVAIAVQHSNESHPEYQATYIDLGNNNIAISFDDAKLLSGVPTLANEVRKAISLAKDSGQAYVTVDKKMKSTLDELKKL